MLSIEERTQLRDDLVNSLLNLSIHRITINNFIKAFSKDPTLQTKYNIYISEFRTEAEAIYCLRNRDDFTNHKCMVCGNLCNFFGDKTSGNYLYQKTCSKKCHYATSHTAAANQKRIDTNLDRFGVEYPIQSLKIHLLFYQKMLDLYGVMHALQHPNFLKKAQDTCERNNGVRIPLKNKDIVEKYRKTYYENNSVKDPIILEEIQPLLDVIKKGLTLAEAYANHDYFKQLIQFLFITKKRQLQTNEIMMIFDRARTTIDQRIHELELEEYFDFQDSNLETSFTNFLIDNNYQKNVNFIRHLFNLQTDHNTRQQLDFTFPNYNLAFEINDTAGHNIKFKDSNYHINKTRMAKNQHNIRLIHLWEWELNETNWTKTSQWILHILNQNKIQLNIFDNNNYDIRLVSKEDQIAFLDQYSFDNNRNFTKSIGIYYNNELIQILSFKDNALCICIKFGYNIIEGTKDIIQYYLQNSPYDYILTYCNLDKFTGKSYEELGFQLLEYQVPSIISELPNESSEYKQLYNCGTNVYVMFKG